MTATRREFLSTALRTTAVVSLASNAPSFLLNAAAMGESKGESILVVVQLTGGNDGLNTIVPYADDEYRKNRPKLGIPTDQLLVQFVTVIQPEENSYHRKER